MSRKIVQVATTPSTENEHSVTVALCDDGTLWQLIHDPASKLMETKWEEYPEIPQPEP